MVDFVYTCCRNKLKKKRKKTKRKINVVWFGLYNKNFPYVHMCMYVCICITIYILKKAKKKFNLN